MRFKNDRGATIVEMALILPLFLIMVFGMIEFSVALYDKAMITNASREGARAGIVFRDPLLTDGEITTVVNNYLASRLITFGGSSTAVTLVTRGGTVTGSPLTVRVTYTYSFLVMPNFIGGGAIPMAAETVMRLE
ncbi:MAG: pilus assembly protein [Acidobacteria bacterium]|nr:MAG: pilus assembly protein [Acidobacteriota bacterium]